MRQCLRTNNAFVGGSLPLTLFSPVLFTPSNADIFVPAARYLPVVHHLTRVQGFDIRSVRSGPDVLIPLDPSHDETIAAYGAGVWHVTTLRRGATVVHVLVVGDSADGLPVDSLSLSWTTALFSFVAADYATCAYPSLVFMGRGLFHMERFMSGMPGTSSDHILNTYADRGFEFARHPSWWLPGPDYSCSQGWSCPFEQRRFGDGGCLTVPAIGGPVNAFGRTWTFGGVSRSVHDT